MAEGNDLTLSYGTILVGRVINVFESEGTWYGRLQKRLLPSPDALTKRLADFIIFCQDWNERVVDNPDSPDAAEFDQYSDLLTSGLWIMTTAEGKVDVVKDAPVFFKGDEISWIVV